MEHVKNFNNQSVGEEIANAITHGAGTLLALAGTAILIVHAALHSSAIGIVSAALYGSSMILLYLFSTLYHSLVPRGAKRVFQIFDHCSIFLLILGTYIPICLNLIGGWFGWTMFGVITASAAAPVWAILAYLVGGGLMYTIGIKFYRDVKHRFAHAIWHLFVLAGTILHYFFIFSFVYPVV